MGTETVIQNIMVRIRNTSHHQILSTNYYHSYYHVLLFYLFIVEVYNRSAFRRSTINGNIVPVNWQHLLDDVDYTTLYALYHLKISTAAINQSTISSLL